MRNDTNGKPLSDEAIERIAEAIIAAAPATVSQNPLTERILAPQNELSAEDEDRLSKAVQRIIDNDPLPAR